MFRCGDRVMQIRNNYDKDVFNGDAVANTADAFNEAVQKVVAGGEPVAPVDFYGEHLDYDPTQRQVDEENEAIDRLEESDEDSGKSDDEMAAEAAAKADFSQIPDFQALDHVLLDDPEYRDDEDADTGGRLQAPRRAQVEAPTKGQLDEIARVASKYKSLIPKEWLARINNKLAREVGFTKQEASDTIEVLHDQIKRATGKSGVIRAGGVEWNITPSVADLANLLANAAAQKKMSPETVNLLRDAVSRGTVPEVWTSKEARQERQKQRERRGMLFERVEAN